MNLTWDEQNLAQGKWFRSDAGSIHFALLRRHDEWRVSRWKEQDFPDMAEKGSRQDLPAELEWERWDCSNEDLVVRLLPSLPELPIIAKPNSSLTIAPGGNALFYIGIPTTVEVHGECGGELNKLTSISTETLSKTWHGDRSEGEVCYSLRTRARRHFDPEDWLTHDIIVSVDLHNESKEPFEFERLFLDLGHFSIFEHEGRLWSNACSIRIMEDDEHGNDITYNPTPLPPAADAREIAHARAGKAHRSTLRRAFASVIDVIN